MYPNQTKQKLRNKIKYRGSHNDVDVCVGFHINRIYLSVYSLQPSNDTNFAVMQITSPASYLLVASTLEIKKTSKGFFFFPLCFFLLLLLKEYERSRKMIESVQHAAVLADVKQKIKRKLF